MAKEKVFAVLGLGIFGRSVCQVLSEKDAKVIAIDNNPELVEKVKDDVTHAILMDTTDEDVLVNAPFEDVDIGIVAIGDDLEASIITTSLLKRIGIPYIVSRAVSEIHEKILHQVGADEVVNIEVAEGKRIAQELISPEILDKIPISKKLSVAEIYVPRELTGKSLRELDLHNKHHINVITIKRTVMSVDEMGNPVRAEDIIFPHADDELKESDVILIAGKSEDIDALRKI